MVLPGRGVRYFRWWRHSMSPYLAASMIWISSRMLTFVWLLCIDNSHYVFNNSHFIFFVFDVFREFWFAFRAYEMFTMSFESGYEIVGSSCVELVAVCTDYFVYSFLVIYIVCFYYWFWMLFVCFYLSFSWACLLFFVHVRIIHLFVLYL